MEFIKWRNYLGEGRIKEAFFKGAFTNTFTSRVFYTLFSFPLPFTPQFLRILQVSSSKILQDFFCLLPSPASVSIPDCPPIVPYSSPHHLIIIHCHSSPPDCKLHKVRAQVLYPQRFRILAT